MPEFTVIVEERHTETIEEIHRAYREILVEVEYRIEAEDEDEAAELVEAGQGEEIDREYHEGDYYDSEYWEGGEVIDSCFEEQEVVNVRDVTSGTVTARSQWAQVYNPPPPPVLKPSWEI